MLDGDTIFNSSATTHHVTLAKSRSAERRGSGEWNGVNPYFHYTCASRAEGWMKSQAKEAAFEQVFLIKVYVGTEVPFKFFFIE